ncbi:hypothetical protein SpCBS45565_g04812 [Spizellomyces sp. 'palustris']|nr:hypothetical protein SpCBS45565_g04812 [Spizellomyces sp. 'palustris']
MAYAASAIAPITARFRKRIIRDLIGSTALGFGIGYYFWYGVHVRKMREIREYDQHVMEEVRREYGDWAAATPPVNTKKTGGLIPLEKVGAIPFESPPDTSAVIRDAAKTE